MDRSKPHFIDGIDINKVFTGDEIIDLYNKGKLRSITLEGYCTRADADGTIRFIPFWESTKFRSENNQMKTHISHDFVETMREEVEHDHPITRRTPQERVASMALRLLSEVKRTGRITGLSDEEVASIVGESWKVGEPLTGEAIRSMSAHLLGKAQVDNREADSHRVTRAHMTA